MSSGNVNDSEALVLTLKAGLQHKIFEVRTGTATTQLLTIRKSGQPTFADLNNNSDIIKLFLGSSVSPCRDLVLGAFRALDQGHGHKLSKCRTREGRPLWCRRECDKLLKFLKSVRIFRKRPPGALTNNKDMSSSEEAVDDSSSSQDGCSSSDSDTLDMNDLTLGNTISSNKKKRRLDVGDMAAPESDSPRSPSGSARTTAPGL